MKLILTYIFITVCLLSSAMANPNEILCFPSDAEDIEGSIAKHNEKSIFSGVSSSGIPMSFYLGKDTYTVIFIIPDGRICTGVNFTGTVIEKLKLNNEKGM